MSLEMKKQFSKKKQYTHILDPIKTYHILERKKITQGLSKDSIRMCEIYLNREFESFFFFKFYLFK